MQRQEELKGLVSALETELSDEMTNKKNHLEDLKKEREFYFDKLRKIEKVGWTPNCAHTPDTKISLIAAHAMRSWYRE